MLWIFTFYCCFYTYYQFYSHQKKWRYPHCWPKIVSLCYLCSDSLFWILIYYYTFFFSILSLFEKVSSNFDQEQSTSCWVCLFLLTIVLVSFTIWTSLCLQLSLALISLVYLIFHVMLRICSTFSNIQLLESRHQFSAVRLKLFFLLMTNRVMEQCTKECLLWYLESLSSNIFFLILLGAWLVQNHQSSQ